MVVFAAHRSVMLAPRVLAVAVSMSMVLDMPMSRFSVTHILHTYLIMYMHCEELC